jgi:L-alanine-DL-glutamate epimerase-like enolase superfamily enzyme
MNRRLFLKQLGQAGILMWAGGGIARARTIHVVDAGGPERISGVEWMVYDTARRAPDNEPLHRGVVRITTSSGVQGWADVSSALLPDDGTRRLIRGLLLGRDPGPVGQIWRLLYEQGVPLGALSGVDVALWDARGRAAQMPVHGLLGTQRLRAPAYLTTDSNLGDPADYAELALAYRERGLHGCKVRPYLDWAPGTNGPAPAGFPDRDIAVYQAVREAVGPDFACMADNEGAYTFDQALRVGRALDELGYAWYESPMPERDSWRDRYVALAGELKTLICAPEALPGSYQERVDWMAAGACDIARIDVRAGGFTACLELARACQAAGIGLELNNAGPDAYPHLQLIAATSESTVKYVETRSLDPEPGPLPGRITPEPVADAQGHVSVPETPGMGLELDWKYIVSHRVA